MKENRLYSERTSLIKSLRTKHLLTILCSTLALFLSSVPAFADYYIMSEGLPFEEGFAAVKVNLMSSSNTNGQTGVYIDEYGQIAYSFEEAVDFSEDKFGNFENGYTHLFYDSGNKCCVMNTDGCILSRYPADHVVAYGSGYTWIENNISTYNYLGYEYTLYDPEGHEEASFKFDSENPANIYYLGNGCFAYNYALNRYAYLEDYDAYNYFYRIYFTKSHSWKESCVSYDDNLEGISFNHNKLVLYTGLLKDGKYHLMIYDEFGNCSNIKIPEELIRSRRSWWGDETTPLLRAQTDKYLLLEAKDCWYYLYDMESDQFSQIQTPYDDYMAFQSNDRFGIPMMDNNRILFSIHGMDRKKYVFFLDPNTLSAVTEPFQCEYAFYSDGILAASDSSSGQRKVTFFNCDMNELFVLDDVIDVLSIQNQLILVSVYFNDRTEYIYYDYEGKYQIWTLRMDSQKCISFTRDVYQHNPDAFNSFIGYKWGSKSISITNTESQNYNYVPYHEASEDFLSSYLPFADLSDEDNIVPMCSGNDHRLDLYGFDELSEIIFLFHQGDLEGGILANELQEGESVKEYVNQYNEMLGKPAQTTRYDELDIFWWSSQYGSVLLYSIDNDLIFVSAAHHSKTEEILTDFIADNEYDTEYNNEHDTEYYTEPEALTENGEADGYDSPEEVISAFIEALKLHELFRLKEIYYCQERVQDESFLYAMVFAHPNCDGITSNIRYYNPDDFLDKLGYTVHDQLYIDSIKTLYAFDEFKPMAITFRLYEDECIMFPDIVRVGDRWYMYKCEGITALALGFTTQEPIVVLKPELISALNWNDIIGIEYSLNCIY